MHLFHGHTNKREQSYRLGAQSILHVKVLLTPSQFCLLLFLVKNVASKSHVYCGCCLFVLFLFVLFGEKYYNVLKPAQKRKF